MITLLRTRLALSENDQLSESAILERNPPYDVKHGIPSMNRSRVQTPELRTFSEFIAQSSGLVSECRAPVRGSEYVSARVPRTQICLKNSGRHLLQEDRSVHACMHAIVFHVESATKQKIYRLKVFLFASLNRPSSRRFPVCRVQRGVPFCMPLFCVQFRSSLLRDHRLFCPHNVRFPSFRHFRLFVSGACLFPFWKPCLCANPRFRRNLPTRLLRHAETENRAI